MKNFITCLSSFLSLIVICATLGCANTERQAAKRIDMTSAVIQEASNLLAADSELSRFPIVVDGFKGDMWLKGHVATPAQKARAAKIVWAVRGVKSVENDLRVGAPAVR